jgi:hypothetical protein
MTGREDPIKNLKN